MATNLGIQPDSKKVYVYRLYSLITDGGSFVYRAVFTNHAERNSGSVAEHIGKYKDAITRSRRQNVITSDQYERLFPDRHPARCADDFDLTLLAFLVRITCVEETADEELRNRVASLDNLRRFRNDIVHIHSTEIYDEAKFEEIWERISLVILQLGQGLPRLEEEIEKLKSNPIDPQRETELQEKIIDLRRKAESAQNVTTRLARLEIGQNRLQQGQDDNARTQGKNFEVLLEHILQIENQSLRLPSPRDLQGNSEYSVRVSANQCQSSMLLSQTKQLTQKDDKSGYTYVEIHQRILTKGTVTALDEMDYEILSRLIGVQWSSLAPHLGLSESHIERIKTNNQRSDIRAHIVEVVRIWGETEKEHATIHRLINAVLECPSLDVTEEDLGEIIKRHI